jgi:terminase large subunit-like protein
MLAQTIGTNRQLIHRPIAVFDPLPWQIVPWRDRSPVMLLTGSAGGGKSRLGAEKLHGYCLKYPGAFALLARKTRVSLTKGSILFLNETVIANDPRVRHLESKDYFRYRNGSILAYAGLEDKEQRERIKSIGPKGGADIVWGEEATEFEEADHNALRARMRGRAANWRQLIYSCNPDAPTHWIYSRLIVGGEAKVYYSGREDNVHNPADYDATMNSLTGVDDLRLNKGMWVQASGVVYDVWNDGPDDGNVTEDAEYVPGGGILLWGVDDGYTGKIDPHTGYYTADSHPRVFGLYQLRHNGDINRFAESYATGLLSDIHIDQVLEMPYPQPDFAVVDKSAAELKGRLHAKGVYTRNSPSDVEESIKEFRSALAKDANGRRRFRVHPRCKHFRAEMASYRRDIVTGKPVKQFDHGPDEARYLVWSQRFEQ